MNRIAIRAALVCAMASLFACSVVADTRLMSLRRSGGVSEFIADTTLVANADVTGDGVHDIVTCSGGAPVVLSKKGDTYALYWYGPNVGCSALAVGDRDADGRADIVVGTWNFHNTQARLYAFDPVRSANAVATATVATPTSEKVNGLAMGDVDSDGHVEIVAVTNGNALVFAGSSLLLEWLATGRGGTDVQIGNIDDDGRTEIVINGSTGHVLDAFAQTLKWSYAGGFGSRMTVANADTDPESEIVFGRNTTITIVNGDDFAISSFDTGDSVYSIAVSDVTGDNKPDIVQGRWPGAKAYDTAGNMVWSREYANASISRMAFGDPDNDSLPEICFVSGSFTDATLVIANLDGTIEQRLPNLGGHYSTAAGDVDGDGQLELIAGAQSNFTDIAEVDVLDFRTGAVKGKLKLPSTTRLVMTQVEVGQLDADPALEILILSGNRYPKLYAFDGATYELQWVGQATPNGLDVGYYMMAVKNMDADPIDEIVVLRSDRTIQLLNGASSTVQWTSPAIGALPIDLAVADVNKDGANDVVLAGSGTVHVFTPATGVSQSFSTDFGNGHLAVTAGHIVLTSTPFLYEPETVVWSYSGSDLSLEWSCTFIGGGSNVQPELVFTRIGGQEHLVVAGGGALLIMPVSASCPTAEHIEYTHDACYAIGSADLTGDGEPELMLQMTYSYDVVALGSTSEPRGDANRDGAVTDTDLESLARYLLANGPGISPSADVTGDGRIDLADVFYLINYRRGTGPAPIP